MLQERDYVRIDKKRLIPEDKGRLVTAFLEGFFKRYVEYDFTPIWRRSSISFPTASSSGRMCCAPFGANSPVRSTRSRICASVEVLEALNEILGPTSSAPNPRAATRASVRTAALGGLASKSASSVPSSRCSDYPDCRFTRQFSDTQNGAPEARRRRASCSARIPTAACRVTLRSGRFGLRCSSVTPRGEEKPKRASVPRGIDAASL